MSDCLYVIQNFAYLVIKIADFYISFRNSVVLTTVQLLIESVQLRFVRFEPLYVIRKQLYVEQSQLSWVLITFMNLHGRASN